VAAQQRLFTNQQHFGVEEGLPQSFISNILQDDDGFIWISTLDGICRYDGRGFKIFRHNPKDSTSIAANVMNNMQRLRNNSIIIFYNAEIADNFNLHSLKASRNKNIDLLKHIPHASWKIEGKDMTTTNRLFMMNNHKGMGWLDTRTGEVFFANRANGLLQQDSLIDIVESAEGKLYLVSEDGVQVSDTGHKKFEWIPFATNVKQGIPLLAGANYIRSSIIWLSGNRLAIGYKDEIVLLDIDKKTSQVIPIAPSFKARTDASTSELQADSKGRPYFVYDGRILRMNANGETELLWENTAKPDLRISAFFIDRSDVLWLSVNAQGLLKIDLKASLFKSYGYETGFATDILKQVLGNQGVIPRLLSYTESSFSFRQTTDKKGNLFFTADWSGEDKIYHLKEGKLQWLPQPPIHHNYATLLTMPDSAIWAYDIPATAWYSWKTSSAVPEKLMLDRETMKTSEVTDALVLGGYIWMATAGNGLLQYEGTKRINRFAGNFANGVIPETLTEVCADPVDKSKFWVGSRGGGLILWDVQKGLQRIYTTEQGLPNNTIYCILPDRSGKIWCSTNKGIFRFDITRGHVTAFEKTDGLPGNEFNRAHKFAFADGRVAFGGLDGYTIFNPSDFDFKEEKEKVPVVLTGLLINNTTQDMSLANSIVKEPLSTLSFLELPYNKNYLRFEFAALLFNQPQKIKYRYQLLGAEADWIENGTNNIASYTALAPGDYTFRINATDNNGLWSDTSREIRILIHPPFWATWWARLVYIIIVIGLARWYFLFRETQLKTKQNLAFEKREALRLKEMDELKDRFFSNITHEFRTPLTLIITPLEKLEQDSSLSAAAISTVKTAQRNSQQLLRLINEFLDFSKLNDGHLKLNLSTGELGLFTANCVQSFEAAAKEKNITLHFSASGCEGFYMFDENKWGKIISNLLSNALKFTPVNGLVSVSLFVLADNINLAVKDTGAGIPPDQQQKIFERFYQVENSSTRTYGGTGIGLSLVKELTELMDGTIQLDSTPGGETCFLVRIPMKKVLGQETDVVTNTTSEPVVTDNGDNDQPLLLVVEDNDELRAFLVETMRYHYRVIEAADGMKAWDLLLAELPDMVISDVMMPGRDGFDLCKICKADNRTAHIGFILLTSKAAHDARLQGLGTGADDYITKPFNLQELELRVTNLLRMQQKQRAWLQSQLIGSSSKEQPPAITDPFLVQLYQEMDAKLDDAELGVEYLSKTMAMSRSTLNRKLKALLDISTNDLIRTYRLQKAAELLSSGLEISSVAYQVGFSSPSYFSQCFKEKYGITPSEHLLKQN
jgi:signal transduction histidine kinase/DNA-binding response OmpR family regulator/ligand-binding sensor domain-containing protein